ncbi:uncharacterized protein LOC122063748 isoform X2 [Macadamia integrifolia]|uniref:uncharacterized protein LOC122063748 isoform X2 n=1 Tax=Macadamia integrifolia TaxID=60698 RepID=UPI001C4FE3ED|nr:uncharacterized protein LOC122063748 isoform X2 [Macadamia integrifolia]
MEAKLIHELEIRLLKSTVFRVPSNSTISYPHRLYSKLLEHKRKSFAKRFQGLAERWKLHARKLSKGQDSKKQFLVHVVKEGETLTSISRLYGVSIQEIAEANATIVDVDLIFEGQFLNIPFSVCKESLMGYSWKNWEPSCKTQERCQRALNLFGRHEDHKIFTMLSSNQLLLVKRTGYFLVLLPLIAFCIRCIMDAFHLRVNKNLKHQAPSESEAYCHGSRTMRWKSALSELTEQDALDDESRQDSVKYPEDQSQVPFEDLSHSYSELGPAYQKFLSQCGMNKFGYWRGGSPD